MESTGSVPAYLTIAGIRSMIDVSVQDKNDYVTPIYNITISSAHNEHIPFIFEAFVNSLNNMLLDKQIAFSQNLIDYLTKQLRDNHDQITLLDREILMKQATNPYLVRDMNKLASELESFRTALQNEKIKLASLRASKRRTEEELSSMDATIFMELSYTEPLHVQLMNLHVDLARALTRSQEEHPRVMAIRANIDKINHMLGDSLAQRTEVRSIARNPLEQQLLSKLLDFNISEISAETHIASLEQVINQIESEMLPDTADMSQQRIVNNRELVMMTIDKLNSKLIDIQSATHGGLYSFIYADQPKTPGSPANKGLYYFLLIGLVLGAMLGAATVFIYDLIDNRIMLLGDFKKLYRLPVIGIVPHMLKSPEKAKKQSPPSYYGFGRENNEACFKIKQLLKREKIKTICICSPMRKEGKSMFSLQMAMGMAEKNMKVLLVDMDIFTPALSLKMEQKKNSPLFDLITDIRGIKDSELAKKVFHNPGLTDFLTGEASLTDTITSTDNPNLSFMPIGSRRARKDDHFFSWCEEDSYKKLIEGAKEDYDIVIFDTPALLFIPDLLNFAEHIDTILPVIRLRHTTRYFFDKMLAMIQSPLDEKLAGVVVNDVRAVGFGNYRDNYKYYGYYED